MKRLGRKFYVLVVLALGNVLVLAVLLALIFRNTPAPQIAALPTLAILPTLQVSSPLAPGATIPTGNAQLPAPTSNAPLLPPATDEPVVDVSASPQGQVAPSNIPASPLAVASASPQADTAATAEPSAIISTPIIANVPIYNPPAVVGIPTALPIVVPPNQPVPPHDNHPYVGEMVKPLMFTGSLSNLPTPHEWQPGDPIYEVPRGNQPGRFLPSPSGSTPGSMAPFAQLLSTARIFTTPDINFSGIGFTGQVPGDPVGDVGPNHYIQATNDGAGTRVRIYDKTRPTPNQLANTTLSTIWTNAGGSGPCRTSGFGDPVVLYDSLANRWLLSELATTGELCVYISQTGDPVNGGWFLYQFNPPNLPDYQKFAVWPDAYYATSNEGVAAVYAFPRAQMLAGNPANFQRFTAPALDGFSFQVLTPADVDGTTAPPSGAPGIFMRHVDTESHPGYSGGGGVQDYLEIWQLSVDFGTPANSTFTGPTTIQIAEFDSNLCGLTSFSCFGKPGFPTGSALIDLDGDGVGDDGPLDPLREPIMWRLAYRAFGSDQRLVGNFVTDVNGANLGGVRWFELRNSGSGWALFQQGTYIGPTGVADGINRWMGSIAMDKRGNIALGYSVSSNSPATFPGIRYTGRLSTDPAGTMPQGETVIVNGASNNGTNRWGDYSAMSIDPTDGCTFWYTNAFGTGGRWGTRIAAFAFDTCFQADLALTKSDNVDPVIAGNQLSYTLSITNNGPDHALNVQVVDTLPVGVTFVSASPGCVEAPVGTVTCSLGTVEAGSTVTVNVVVLVLSSVPDGTILTNNAAVSTSSTDPNAGNNNASQTTQVIAQADLAIEKVDDHDPAVAGQDHIVYTITVQNNGPSDAQNVSVVDTLPAGVTFVSASAGCAEAPVGTVTCTIGTLAAGAQVNLSIEVSVNASTKGTITNSAQVSSTTTDPDSSNNTATQDTQVIFVVDLEIVSMEILNPPSQIIAGQNVVVTLRTVIDNNGPSGPVDTLFSQTASSSAFGTVTPGATSSPQLALAINEMRVVDTPYTISCSRGLPKTFTFNNAIEPLDPADTDPDLTNNAKTLDLVVDCVIPVAIDIHPHNPNNPVNLKGNGVLPVAILSNAEFQFDATTVDPNTVFLAGAPVRPFGNNSDKVILQDVNQDGLMDAVVHIEVNQLNLSPGDTVAVMVGKTFPQSVVGDPQPPGPISFTGQDFVNIVPDSNHGNGQTEPGGNAGAVIPLPTAALPSAATPEPALPTETAVPPTEESLTAVSTEETAPEDAAPTPASDTGDAGGGDLGGS